MSTPPPKPRRRKLKLDDGSAKDICARLAYDPMHETILQMSHLVWEDDPTHPDGGVWLPYFIHKTAEEDRPNAWRTYFDTNMKLNEFLRGKKRQTETKEQHDYNINVRIESFSPDGTKKIMDVSPAKQNKLQLPPKIIEKYAKKAHEQT